jgi:hypothetical protein
MGQGKAGISNEDSREERAEKMADALLNSIQKFIISE